VKQLIELVDVEQYIKEGGPLPYYVKKFPCLIIPGKTPIYEDNLDKIVSCINTIRTNNMR
jgi:hypothetical protein